MKRLISLLLLIFAVQTAAAWGPKGHDVVAYIAECNVNNRVKAKVMQALDGHTFTYYSSWADNIRNFPEFRHTSTWHYANVDEGYTYATMPKNPKGDVLTAVTLIVEQLKSGKITPEEENIYLRMLIHFVGDMHCPMHAGRLSDLGGNLVTVKWFGREVKLHAVWDDLIVESVRKWSYSEWQREIDNVSRKEREALSAGAPLDWMNETVAICQQVYKDAPAGSELSWDYQNENYPLLEMQLRKAGYRLARLLNEIYK
jgi:hypothetical protein